MSHDQRPSRVRVVASRDATAASAASTEPLRAGDVVASATAKEATSPAKRGMMVPSLVFCIGCAVGGLGLGAALLAH